MSQPLPSTAIRITYGPAGERRESAPIENTAGQRRRTPREILDWMVRRRKELGAPLPEGYIAPPGIDIEELLKQLPPLPPKPEAP